MIAITGASGHLGQRVLHHLLYTLNVPVNRIVAASRNPAKLAEWAAKGVTTRALDFDDPATYATAFANVQRVLLISTDALDRPGRRLQQHQNVLQAMARLDIQHIVYTSMPQPEQSPLLLAPDHEGTEKALAASNLPGWTVLRNHWYFENLLMSLPAVLASGKWYSADGGGLSADIARDDLARAAATVLAGSESGKHIYTLSGGQALSRVEIAQRVSAMIGKSIEVAQVPLASLVQGMVGAGLPEPLARIFASFDTNTAAGRVAQVSDDYRKITGVSQQSFDDWLVANKAALITA